MHASSGPTNGRKPRGAIARKADRMSWGSHGGRRYTSTDVRQVRQPSHRLPGQKSNNTPKPVLPMRCEPVVVSRGPVYRRRAGNLNTTPLGNTTRIYPRPMNLLVTGIITHRCRGAETSKLEPFRPSQVSAWISVMFAGKVSCILPGNTTTTANLLWQGSCPLCSHMPSS
ncbi:hypothetical protein EDD15DRAFT_322987 [Pisolithus albus]|nr:hypothetical protein EDD15DRAFT_322987 [Pisolithus albus]